MTCKKRQVQFQPAEKFSANVQLHNNALMKMIYSRRPQHEFSTQVLNKF
ncbi:MAG: hypothetical protein IKN27_00545 [Selenomonadaceae bacterium]|nr:hypothetical protein [Selenomonadaceae bacterium]